MASKIYIYKVNIDPTRNMVVENLETLLGNLTPVYTDTDFQFIKPELERTIKVNIKTDYDLSLVRDGNFIKVVEKPNSDSAEVTFYYFITAARWLADSTVEFTIALDTLNTFWSDITTNINNKTHITRQHKDRFTARAAASYILPVSGTVDIRSSGGGLYSGTYSITNPDFYGLTPTLINITTNNNSVGAGSATITDDMLTINFGGSGTVDDVSFSGTVSLTRAADYVRKIDTFSEGINPLLVGTNQGEVYDDTEDNWYLVYTGNPVQCYLYPETPIDLYVPGSTTISPGSLIAGRYYYIMEDRTSGDYIIRNKFTTAAGNIYPVAFENCSFPIRHCVCFCLDGNNIKIKKLLYRYNWNWFGWALYAEGAWETTSSLTVTGTDFVAHILTTYKTDLTPIYGGSTTSFTITSAMQTLNSFSSVNRQDSDLVKIIKLPYSPFNTGDVGANWSYNSTHKCLQLNYLDSRLTSTLYAKTNPLSELVVNLNPSILDAHDISRESKLYHSDFYQPKFTYDSFSKKFDLERVNLDGSLLNSDSVFSCNFTATNTINSRFLFTFNQYDTDGKQLEDYDNILVASRNNEMTIYTSAYMDYLKTGYNYDVKAKNLQAATTVGTTLISAAGSAALLALGASGGNPVAAAVGVGVGLIGGIISVVSQTQSSANSIAQKEAQYKNQASSVTGTDDIDLLTAYSNNKAKLMTYQPTDQMKNALYNIFRLTGYACDEYAKPDFSSRYWYNFIQCDPQFTHSTTAIYEDFLDDIKNRFQIGVTIFHGNGVYDINQTYENWETSLLS